eukprot:CAMPEP_0182441400 /NCGR_PEP_ID=MMETSP1172-20130603/361_1 /TAXON_ID=708627 /ORGANISM="Timspurckia oligopyrenoides, Strain CCMP3278" /LENGTH=443 /DNA_ID=CAMNT_0024635649 /DNA_START=47 /DNA_END=1378 /DNA_ORIENTATION=+
MLLEACAMDGDSVFGSFHEEDTSEFLKFTKNYSSEISVESIVSRVGGSSAEESGDVVGVEKEKVYEDTGVIRRRSFLDDLTKKEIQKLKSKLETDTLDLSSFRPKARFVVDFPVCIDSAFAEFDDYLIERIQSHTELPVYIVSVAFSALTSIETAIWMPFVLFALGYDNAATVMTNVLIILSLCSQIPKRFVWRARPWMEDRAIGVRKDPTSGFPSRGVTCAVVFPTMILFAIETEGFHIPLWIYVVSVVALVIFTSFARINVGAHYPSDALGGMVLGIIVLCLSFHSLSIWNGLGCSSSDKYPVAPELTLRPGAFWKLLDSRDLLVAVIGSCMFSLLSGLSPITFWLKNNYVYGLLLSSLTFRFVFLCPSCSNHGSGLSFKDIPSLSDHIQMIIIGGLLIAFSFAFKPRRKGMPEWFVNAQRLLKFMAIYTTALWMMISSRL